MPFTRVNWNYLKFYQEIPLFWALRLARTRRHPRQPTTDVLIVNPCLIGEFAASVPALSDFIQGNPGIAVDLMVTPPLAGLAKRIRGVRRIFLARSLYERAIEGNVGRQDMGAYHRVLVMRATADCYRMVRRLRTHDLRTNAWRLLRYGMHLAQRMRQRKTPALFGDVAFEMLGGSTRAIPFETIFAFSHADHHAILRILPEHLGTSIKVLIHTDASWVMNRWPLDHWVALLRRLRAIANIRFILVGEGAAALADQAYIAARLPFKVDSLIGRTRIEELLLVMRHCEFFIGVDSGPANLAHLANLRSITLLGPPPHMYMPPDKRDIAIDRSNGRGIVERYVRKRNAIIERITPDDVYDAFIALLSASGIQHAS